MAADTAKGWGLISTRKIERGALIVREKPFLTVQHPITGDAVKAAFDRADESSRILFLSFESTAPGTTGIWDGIAETNVIPAPGKTSATTLPRPSQSPTGPACSRTSHGSIIRAVRTRVGSGTRSAASKVGTSTSKVELM